MRSDDSRHPFSTSHRDDWSCGVLLLAILLLLPMCAASGTPQFQHPSLPASPLLLHGTPSHTNPSVETRGTDAPSLSGLAALRGLEGVLASVKSGGWLSRVDNAARVMDTTRLLPHAPLLPQARTLAAPGDTLIVGPGSDSLRITGVWEHTGAILVVGQGRLIFDNASCTIYGNVVVWGTSAALVVRNSTLFFPQEYFYQRSMIVAGGGSALFERSTLDYGSLSHSLAVTDSASVRYRAVTVRGFTTCGLSGRGSMTVDTCNETGEFILQDETRIDFREAHTVLLWFRVGAGQTFHTSFPDGAAVDSATFGAGTPGLANIHYTASLRRCTNVMWALMPAPASDIRIGNSAIRAIGLWFTGADSTAVSGLVNNSTYTQFPAPLVDRTLLLENTRVSTWSLYTFDRSVVHVTGCILGEIGTFGASRMTCEKVMVDGSGGYLFASDTSFLLYGFSSATCPVRSERSGALVFAYSALSNGAASAIGTSILIVVQSGLLREPVPYEGSITWLAEIGTAASARVGERVAVTGSAWIDRGPISALFDFRKYVLSYQRQGETQWTRLADTVFREARNASLGEWNTAGLAPGVYSVRLTVTSDTRDAFSIDAQTPITLLPPVSAVEDPSSPVRFTVYPNPAADHITLDGVHGDVSITDALAREIWRGTIEGSHIIPTASWRPGMYFIRTHTACVRVLKVL
ncbi:MAG: T9SS type A sorting domain-containing protein [Ignavibacteriae bacterium]|nr:T9SS type A sorting domain-containing protein [Ignavibacteriota bacterium]